MKAIHSRSLRRGASMLALCLATGAAHAYYSWETVTLPASSGASCGNGTPYRFFVNRALFTNATVLVYEGGGACWDQRACQGGPDQETAEHRRSSALREETDHDRLEREDQQTDSEDPTAGQRMNAGGENAVPRTEDDRDRQSHDAADQQRRDRSLPPHVDRQADQSAQDGDGQTLDAGSGHVTVPIVQ